MKPLDVVSVLRLTLGLALTIWLIRSSSWSRSRSSAVLRNLSLSRFEFKSQVRVIFTACLTIVSPYQLCRHAYIHEKKTGIHVLITKSQKGFWSWHCSASPSGSVSSSVYTNVIMYEDYLQEELGRVTYTSVIKQCQCQLVYCSPLYIEQNNSSISLQELYPWDFLLFSNNSLEREASNQTADWGNCTFVGVFGYLEQRNV